MIERSRIFAVVLSVMGVWGLSAWAQSSRQRHPQMPSGSYSQSCRNCNYSDGSISCECRTTQGQWQKTQLALPCKASGGATNCNGTLKCGPCL